MLLQYFVLDSTTGTEIPIEIEPAESSDLLATKNCWQSDWTSDFIQDPLLEKRVAKTGSGEIVALGAYREKGDFHVLSRIRIAGCSSDE